MASTVGDVLQSEGIELGEHDVVAPAPETKLVDGTQIAVQYGRQVTVTVDGQPQTFWTTATNVDQALASLDIDTAGADLSTSRSAAIGRDGLDVQSATAKTITIDAAGKKRRIKTTAQTVGEALAAAKITVDADDKVSVNEATRLDGRRELLRHPGRREDGDQEEKVAYDTRYARTPTSSTGARPRSRPRARPACGPSPTPRSGTTASCRAARRRIQGHQEADDTECCWSAPRSRRNPRRPVSPPAAATSPAASGTGSPSASRAATGRSTPATATTAGCSSPAQTWRAYGGSGHAAPEQPRRQQIAIAKKLPGRRGLGPVAGLLAASSACAERCKPGRACSILPAPFGGWRRGSTCGRPSSAARTSSSTPTPCGGSSPLAGCRPDDVVLEIGPGLGSLTLGLLAAADRVRRGGDRPAAGRGAARHRGRAAPDRRPRADASSRPTPSGSTTLPLPPTVVVANLPVQRLGAGAAAPARHVPQLVARAGDGAGRGRRPAGRRPRVEDLRRAVGEDGLVRRGQPGSAPCRRSCSGRCPTSTRGWWRSTAGRRRRPRPAESRCSRWSTRPSPSGARCCAPRWPVCWAPARGPATIAGRGRSRPTGPRRGARRGRLRPDRRVAGRPRAGRSSATRPADRIASTCGLTPTADHGRRPRTGAGQDQPGAQGGPAAPRRVPPAGHGLPGGVAVRRGARGVGRARTSSRSRVSGEGADDGAARRQQPGGPGGAAAGRDPRAARLARRQLSIKKSIPVAGGLAGGSSNAAAALLACAVLWDLDVSPEPCALAAELGSDVPFALLGGTAVGSGRGEEVMPALARGTYHWVLGVRPPRAVHPGGLPALRPAQPAGAAAGGAGRPDERAALRRSCAPGSGA